MFFYDKFERKIPVCVFNCIFFFFELEEQHNTLRNTFL
jgi:hypothetical protein